MSQSYSNGANYEKHRDNALACMYRFTPPKAASVVTYFEKSMPRMVPIQRIVLTLSPLSGGERISS
jgi:hypothetical protein